MQLFLQSGSAYNCVSELGELGLVEFRDVSPVHSYVFSVFTLDGFRHMILFVLFELFAS